MTQNDELIPAQTFDKHMLDDVNTYTRDVCKVFPVAAPAPAPAPAPALDAALALAPAPALDAALDAAPAPAPAPAPAAAPAPVRAKRAYTVIATRVESENNK